MVRFWQTIAGLLSEGSKVLRSDNFVCQCVRQPVDDRQTIGRSFRGRQSDQKTKNSHWRG